MTVIVILLYSLMAESIPTIAVIAAVVADTILLSVGMVTGVIHS